MTLIELPVGSVIMGIEVLPKPIADGLLQPTPERLSIISDSEAKNEATYLGFIASLALVASFGS